MIKNLKKVISTLAAVAILATSASAFAVTFPDVDESAAYAPSVDILTSLGIVDGDDNGKFNPDNTVTRAEFTKMVVEAIGEGDAAASSSWTKFVDSQNHWAAGYIETGVSKGFINGYDDTTFGPDDQVTYEQAVKMLVAAIGYTTYAEMAGGYPGGYLSYGSSLKIINGVNGVTNTTALTRAQVAVLIANTLKAPICIPDGFIPNYGTGEMVPDWQPQDGKAEDWKTLLTEEHDAWTVKGRVETVAPDKTEGSFLVETAENFDGYQYAAATPYTAAGVAIVGYTGTTVNFGDTKAADMQFQYSEAIIQKDADTDEYVIVAITPYGAVKTVEFAAEDIKDIDDTTRVLSVKKEGSNKTDDYDLNPTADGGVKVFVNGEEKTSSYEPFTSFDATADLVLGENNIRGTVTLVNTTNVGSTATDRDYDVIMVTNYIAGKVDSVRVKNDNVKISASAATFNWDLDDEDMNVKFYKDGAEISYEDVKEDDIILVAANGALASAKWIEVYVSDATVSGVPTSQKDNDIVVDGTEYTLAGATVTLGTNYTMFLDAMGFVVEVEEGETENQNIAIVADLYKTAGGNDYTVVLFTTEGEVEYKVSDADTKTALVDITGGAGSGINEEDRTLKTAGAAAVASRTIEYRITSGKLKMVDQDDPANGVTAADIVAPANSAAPSIEYRESTSKLGNYTVSETVTKFIDLDAYLNTPNGEAATYAYENLEDENVYQGYVYLRNTKGVFRLAVLTGNTTTIRPTSSIAVVMSSGSTTTAEDGTPVQMLTVAKDGQEDVEVLIDAPTATVAEGTVIMYTVGADGYVDYTNDFYALYTPAADYDTMMNDVIAQNIFTEVVNDGTIIDDNATAESGYTLAGVGALNTDVSIYYGPVYRATSDVLDLFIHKTSTAAGVDTIPYTADDTYAVSSNVNTNVESFTLAGANVYSFNFDANTGDGVSVTADKAAQSINIFKNMYISATNDSDVDWSKVDDGTVVGSNTLYYVDCAPAVAFVRVVDGDVTDVIYYTQD